MKATAYSISYNQPERSGPFRWHVYRTITGKRIHLATSATKAIAIAEAKEVVRNLGGRLEATGYQTL
jgi:hypothetical protein